VFSDDKGLSNFELDYDSEEDEIFDDFLRNVNTVVRAPDLSRDRFYEI
jgi:hypothetical protein